MKVHENAFVAFAVFLVHTNTLPPICSHVNLLTDRFEHHFHQLAAKCVIIYYHDLFRFWRCTGCCCCCCGSLLRLLLSQGLLVLLKWLAKMVGILLLLVQITWAPSRHHRARSLIGNHISWSTIARLKHMSPYFDCTVVCGLAARLPRVIKVSEILCLCWLAIWKIYHRTLMSVFCLGNRRNSTLYHYY
jgi:hypothetical protein